jgi:hypothetical protein
MILLSYCSRMESNEYFMLYSNTHMDELIKDKFSLVTDGRCSISVHHITNRYLFTYVSLLNSSFHFHTFQFVMRQVIIYANFSF